MIIEDVFSPSNMKLLGFDFIEGDGVYLKYENDGTKHRNTDYNKQFPEPKGKVVLNVNLKYGGFPYVSIRQDGGTRSVYAGIVKSEVFLEELLNSVR